MSLEDFGISRKVCIESANLSGIYVAWAQYLQRYECDAIISAWKDEFAKTHTIHTLYCSMQHGTPTAEQGDLLKALLTDRGLLFPQTRERYYDLDHSMRLSTAAFPRYHEAADRISSSESPLDRLLALGKECYVKGRDRFYERHGKLIPFITLEEALTGIKTLVDGREGPFHIQEMSKEYKWGYISSEMSKPENANHPAAIALYAKQWLDHATFTWGDGETESSLSPQRLQEALGFPAIECYGFIAYVLSDCLCKDEQYREWGSAEYTPGLDSSQLKDFEAQLSSFKKETLSRWKAALPVLKEYLHPDLGPMKKRAKSTFTSGSPGLSEEAACKKLQKIFQEYLRQMEPSRRNASMSTEDTDGRTRLSRMAEWFLSSSPEGSPSDDVMDRPFFMDRPHLIFGLFRSPVHRYIFNWENRAWNPLYAIRDACEEFPLPITSQSIDEDTKLFRGIVNICADMCRQNHIPFQKDAWDALWDCIEQCVRCLTFQIGDLFSVRNGFTYTLYLGAEGAPVLDRWIEGKLTSGAPNYILIWRALIKNRCKPSPRLFKIKEQWTKDIDDYRSFFEEASVNSGDALAHLDNLSSKINWTGIPFLPPSKELAAICSAIKPGSRKGTADMIRHGWSGKEAQVRNEFQRLWMEWFLIQCVCDQAQRELMEVVYLYLTQAEGYSS